MRKAVAIDGPAGTGKSTIAKLVAKLIDMVYIDTGAMFRTIALYFIENNLDYTRKEVINEHIDNVEVDLKYSNKTNLMYLNGRDVTDLIRTEDVSNGASAVAKNKKVREKLLEIQKKIAQTEEVVMDGRDIGTCVLPDAALKIYLTADAEERARRRYNQLLSKGKDAKLDDVLKELEKRDYQDMNRKIAPLKKAEDAVEIDTTSMTIKEVVDKIVLLSQKQFA